LGFVVFGYANHKSKQRAKVAKKMKYADFQYVTDETEKLCRSAVKILCDIVTQFQRTI